MSDRKHISELVLDVIDVQRKLREAGAKLPSPLSIQIELALQQEVQRLEAALRESFNSSYRLLVLTERLTEGKTEGQAK